MLLKKFKCMKMEEYWGYMNCNVWPMGYWFRAGVVAGDWYDLVHVRFRMEGGALEFN